MTVREEVLLLVGLVLAVDVVFVAGYFLASVERASDPVKLGFTGVWTVVTLAIALRGLIRIRTARLKRSGVGKR